MGRRNSLRRAREKGERARADKSLAMGRAVAESGAMRIARNNQVMGDWSADVVIARLESGESLPTDSFYDEDTSEWRPLSELRAKLIAAKPAPRVVWACYCGSGIPFSVCCGDGRSY